MTDARLLIPLSALPGLDPVGLVVRFEDTDAAIVSGELLDFGMIACCRVGATWTERVTNVAVSLSDPATRDRCLRWLAGRVGLEVGCGSGWWSECVYKENGWELAHPDDQGCIFWGGEVPALADLDPADNTHLPDGSRLVDALALAAVLRHVGGRQDTAPSTAPAEDLQPGDPTGRAHHGASDARPPSPVEQESSGEGTAPGTPEADGSARAGRVPR